MWQLAGTQNMVIIYLNVTLLEEGYTIIELIGGGEEAEYIGSYTPCSKKHEASKESEFPDGFVDYNRNGREDEGEAVIVWIERGPWGGIRNAHATTNLDRDSWETAKS